MPSQLPLSLGLRERGSSVTGAFEGWFKTKDGGTALLVGYMNRNSKQELDIPVGPNNRIEPGGPDMGQPTHFLSGRYWGVFTIKLPKDFGDKKLTWTIVANGFTNAITLHTKTDYILEPYRGSGEQEHAAGAEVLADGCGGARVHQTGSPRRSRPPSTNRCRSTAGRPTRRGNRRVEVRPARPRRGGKPAPAGPAPIAQVE